jgi:hypothetical protein
LLQIAGNIHILSYNPELVLVLLVAEVLGHIVRLQIWILNILLRVLNVVQRSLSKIVILKLWALNLLLIEYILVLNILLDFAFVLVAISLLLIEIQSLVLELRVYIIDLNLPRLLNIFIRYVMERLWLHDFCFALILILKYIFLGEYLLHLLWKRIGLHTLIVSSI